MNLRRSEIETLLRDTPSTETQKTAPPTTDARTAIWLPAANAPANRANRVLLPGAFNPLHSGHTTMATVAADLLGLEVDFEISVINVDKPPLNYPDVAQRAAQFAERANLWLTRAPTFVAKAELFPHATFVIGIDTLARIANPRYYASDLRARDAALRQLTTHGCRFLVFGRLYDGKFQTLADLTLPNALRTLCDEVPAATFRQDISSTELRSATPYQTPTDELRSD